MTPSSLPSDGVSTHPRTVHDQARSVAQQALTTANTIPDKYDRRRTLVEVAKGLAQAGDLDQALATANMIHDDEERFPALVEMAKGLAQAGDLGQALRIANTIPEDYKARALVEVAEGFAEAGDLDQALRIANTIPDSYSRAKALAGVAETLAHAGH